MTQRIYAVFFAVLVPKYAVFGVFGPSALSLLGAKAAYMASVGGARAVEAFVGIWGTFGGGRWLC